MGQHGFASVKAPIRSGPACDRPVRDRSAIEDSWSAAIALAKAIYPLQLQGQPDACNGRQTM